MDPIKEAFTRAKEDIEDLKYHISFLQEELQEIKRTLKHTTDTQNNQTNQQIYPTHNSKTDSNMPLEALKSPKFDFSTGNEGVPTNQPTNQQTNTNPIFSSKSNVKPDINSTIQRLEGINTVISSLDNIKKELRTQFKKLTHQEMLVFSTIYQFNEENKQATYLSIAEKLNLSEISIRDYALKIIKKGIPLIKEKTDNKKVFLKIPSELVSLASLQTIIQLREI